MRTNHVASCLREAKEASWQSFGKQITFCVPGMFHLDGVSARHQAISITGDRCALQCDHCRARILSSMFPATTPGLLVEQCLKLSAHGVSGVLVSGGCDSEGRLPWKRFASAIRELKDRTGLFVSVHSGLVDDETAQALRGAGVDQALIDVIGDDETFREVCHIECGVSRIAASLEALCKAGISVVPHIVCGLHFGEIRGERKALERICSFDLKQVVICSLMRIPGTPAWDWPMPEAGAVADFVAEARIALPAASLSLGCARQRGNRRLEILAIDAGVNRMALPSEEAIEHARKCGLEIRYQATCCSVPEGDRSAEFPAWPHGRFLEKTA